jgi:HSP20 family protein
MRAGLTCVKPVGASFASIESTQCRMHHAAPVDAHRLRNLVILTAPAQTCGQCAGPARFRSASMHTWNPGRAVMSNLSRYDPFPADPLADLFQGFFRPMRSVAGEQETGLSSMKIDVAENESSYTVNAELPGLDKKDIDVQIDGSRVSINAKAERSREQKEGERVIRRERYSGAFSRTFSLESEVDGNTAHAEYKDGVLSLVLPKKTAIDRKRLTIG